MADKVTLKLGKETLEVATPTHEGITALESLGWQVESGTKPSKPRRQSAKAAAPAFDEAKAREEIAVSLRAEITEQVRAELKAQAEAEAGSNEGGEQKPAENGDAAKTAAAKK